MIFITVGTNYNDSLVRRVDELAPSLREPILIQIGEHGKYLPKNCKFFRIAPSLEEYYEKADLVISSGGVGATFELLHRGSSFISISNPDAPDQHQDELLEKLTDEQYVLWCKDLADLKSVMDQAKEFKAKKYIPPKCFMDKVIIDFLVKG